MTNLEKRYVEKLKEYLKYILKYACVTEPEKSIRMTRFESEIYSLRRQIEVEIRLEENKILSRELTIEEIEEIKNSKFNWDEIFREAKLKEELHEFRKYMNTRGYPFVCMDSDIDEYLKHRNNG